MALPGASGSRQIPPGHALTDLDLPFSYAMGWSTNALLAFLRACLIVARGTGTVDDR